MAVVRRRSSRKQTISANVDEGVWMVWRRRTMWTRRTHVAEEEEEEVW